MKVLVAGFTAVVLLGLVVVTSIAACPFLQPGSSSSHGCCSKSRGNTGSKKCPLSSTEETCPLYLSEAKLGITKGKFQSVTPGHLSPPVLALAPVVTEQPIAHFAPSPVASDLYLANRVLRL